MKIKSSFKNIYWHSQNKNWVAKVKINYRSKHIGSFATEEEANKAVLKYKIDNNIFTKNGNQPSLKESFKYVNGQLQALYNGQNYHKGDFIGCICKTHGYINIGHNGNLYKAHFIIWDMFNPNRDKT